MNSLKPKRTGTLLLSAFLYIAIASQTLFSPLILFAAPNDEPTQTQTDADERQHLPIKSNRIANWPEGPVVSAHSAILMEANTGTILYDKNIHDKMYPASTTKIMTSLIAAENSAMNETVSFSHDAVFGIEDDSSNIGIDVGQSMPMEECLYGILVASANEVANAVAEHIAGNMDDFADMMNQKAQELGCENTHFTNAHGLYDDNHYTTAYDLAVISQAFFNNELLSKIGNTPSYHFKATVEQPDDFIVRNKHKLITGEIPCDGIKGGKTGYTDEAGQTLVTCAERNGMKLICVVMMEESPDQFNDTVKLFDYGFTNFTITNVSQNETNYQTESIDFFHTSYDVFGNSDILLSLDQNSYIILPKTLDFADVDSSISYESLTDEEVARILYSYQDIYLGMASINLITEDNFKGHLSDEPFITNDNAMIQTETESQTVFVNVKLIIIITVCVALLLSACFVAYDLVTGYQFADIETGKPKRKSRRAIKRERKKGPHFPSHHFKDFDF